MALSVEVFRGVPNILHPAYLAITVACIVSYLHLAPYVVHTFQRKIPRVEKSTEDIPVLVPKEFNEALPAVTPVLSQFTARKLEVLELIGGGYSNKDIAKIMFISERTVNDYTKKIYRKLDVHSRHVAA